MAYQIRYKITILNYIYNTATAFELETIKETLEQYISKKINMKFYKVIENENLVKKNKSAAISITKAQNITCLRSVKGSTRSDKLKRTTSGKV
jgi:hypothetical protein